MDPETLGLIGGIAGSVIGALGGVFGTYMSIKNTSGPRERAFVIRASIGCWLLVIIFLIAMILLPNPQRHWLWIPYAIILPLGIIAWNRRQSQIRQEESGTGLDGACPPPVG